MTDNHHEQYHYDRQDDRVHDLFAQVADDPAPALGFTADGIAGLGRRGARTRRIAAVSGATAGIAAVGIAIAALPGAVGAGRGEASPGGKTGGPAATSTSAPADPICAADVAKAFSPHSGMDSAAGKQVALQECPALRAIDALLDPTGKHLVETDSAQRVITPDIVWGENGGKDGFDGTSASFCYNNEGPASNQNQGTCAELPEVSLQVTFSLPGAPDPAPQSGDMTLANRAPGVGSGEAAWVQKSSTTLTDGSTVTVGEVQNGDRVSIKARRVLPSGAALTILAFDGYDSSSAVEQPGTVYNPFPFSVEKMAAAASVEQFVTPDALKAIPKVPGMDHPTGVPSKPGMGHPSGASSSTPGH